MKNLTLTFLLLFASSIAYGDDLTEYGELVSIEGFSTLSDELRLEVRWKRLIAPLRIVVKFFDTLWRRDALNVIYLRI